MKTLDVPPADLNAERRPPVAGKALLALVGLAGLYALHAAGPVLVPMLLALLCSHALTPLVDRLVAWRVPRGLAAALLLAGIVGVVGSLAWRLADDAAAMVEALPETARKLRQAMEHPRSPSGGTAIDQMQRAAMEIERAAQPAAASAPALPRGVTKVQVEKPHFDVKDYLWPGALGLAAAAGQATVVLFITFFLLAAGDSFRRKLVRMAGPDFAHQRLTVQALQEIESQVRRYLQVQVLTSVLVGVATWAAFLAIGVEHAGVWGVAACVLNFVPYLGGLVVALGAALMAFVQFGQVQTALMVAAASLFITGLEGHGLTPWLTSRASRMNPLAVFVGVLACGALLGAWGLVLGMPILLIVKAVCDRVDLFKGVGEMLGD
ncbi:putative permease [Burkholderiales bacterium JOSHI_001]|nr:putative permease [Burkholderiales bacterium JOSHI_001]